MINVCYWKVNLVANEFEQFSESGFVVLSSLSIGKFEVHFGEVHTDGLWNESLEHFESKFKTDTISFGGSCALESFSVNTIDVERNPVFGVSLMVEVLVNCFVHLFESFDSAVYWFENESLLFCKKCNFLFFE